MASNPSELRQKYSIDMLYIIMIIRRKHRDTEVTQTPLYENSSANHTGKICLGHFCLSMPKGGHSLDFPRMQ